MELKCLLHNYAKLFIYCLITVGLIACESHSKITIPGYIEGRYIYVSSLFSGTIKSLQVTPGAEVKANQILFVLDPELTNENLAIAQAHVEQAINQLSKTNANVELQKANNDRNTFLLKKGIIPKEEFEQGNTGYQQAIADKKVAQARLASLKTDEKKARWNINKKTVAAPKDAIVFDTYYTEGENVQANAAVLSLLDPMQVKAIFFIPESLLGTIKINDLIKISYDSSKEPIQAKITYISTKAEYNPPILYSSEERQRLVFRVEATPEIKLPLSKIHPGQPVTILLE